MSNTLENRKNKVEEFLGRVNNSPNEVQEIRETEVEPQRYLVGEYESGDLVWFWTAESLDEAEKDINNHEASTPRDYTVFDLDTPRKEHRVTMIATVQR